MSEQNRTSMRDPNPTAPFSESESSADGNDENDLSHVPPVHQDVVERLRSKVEEAAAYIDRLERENEELRRRVDELEQRPAISPDKTALALDEEPENLRKQISTYIDAIDTYLREGPADTNADTETTEDSTS